jgi:basic membrane protein A and related proteins
VAIVLPGVITDRSFNQAGYEGVERAAEELSIESSPIPRRQRSLTSLRLCPTMLAVVMTL